MERTPITPEALARVHARFRELGMNPGTFEESERRRLRELDRQRKKRERFLANPTAVAIEAIARPFRSDKNGFIYFVECAGYVKIGFTTEILGRMGGIQSHTPLDLRLLGFLTGPIQVEGRVQVACDKFHHRREWYRGDPELLEAVKMTSVNPRKLLKGKEAEMDEARWIREYNKKLALYLG